MTRWAWWPVDVAGDSRGSRRKPGGPSGLCGRAAASDTSRHTPRLSSQGGFRSLARASIHIARIWSSRAPQSGREAGHSNGTRSPSRADCEQRETDQHRPDARLYLTLGDIAVARDLPPIPVVQRSVPWGASNLCRSGDDPSASLAQQFCRRIGHLGWRAETRVSSFMASSMDWWLRNPPRVRRPRLPPHTQLRLGLATRNTHAYPQTLEGETDLCVVIVMDSELLKFAFYILFPWGPTPRYCVKAEADRLRFERISVRPRPEATRASYTEVLESEVAYVRRKGFFPLPGLGCAIDYRRYDLVTTDGRSCVLLIMRRQPTRKQRATSEKWAITRAGADAAVSWLDRASRLPRPSLMGPVGDVDRL